MSSQETTKPTVSIRSFDRTDARELQILIGMSVFEQLPEANWQAYVHPFVIAAWVTLSSIFIQIMGWWPQNNISALPYFGYLTPLPAFGAMGVPILFLVDWLQRPYFEKELRRELTSEDILNATSYYLLGPSKLSRFSILEWKNRPIGYIAIDAASPDEKLSNLEDDGALEGLQDGKVTEDAGVKTSPVSTKQLKPKRGVVRQDDLPDYAVIRHFHVDRVYQQAGIQYDFMQTIVNEIFEASRATSEESKQKINKIFVRVTSTQPKVEAAWRRFGFQDSTTRKGGKVAGSGVLFGHYERWLELSKLR